MVRSTVLSRTRVVAMAVALAVLALVAWQLAAPRDGASNAQAATGVTIYMTVTGQQQGAFKGDDVTGSKLTGLLAVSGYQFELVSPRDPATGQSTGRRTYKPIVVTHLLGGSSPQFLRAAATNETLKSVVINFYRVDRTGRNFNYYRITLTNANVSDVHQYLGASTVLEDDSFVFQKIEQQDFSAHTDFVDNLGIAATAARDPSFPA